MKKILLFIFVLFVNCAWSYEALVPLTTETEIMSENPSFMRHDGWHQPNSWFWYRGVLHHCHFHNRYNHYDYIVNPQWNCYWNQPRSLWYSTCYHGRCNTFYYYSGRCN
ncbi:MAG: hypothetical protein HYW47_04585 [Deltaproteobacteria bacterium]|nr:hypothetical protein [Deltaproteobacteria bacterium]